MRTARRPRLSCVIDAPPAAVWQLVCDIQTPAEFSSEFQGGQWLDGATGPALGARFRGRNFHEARGTWETVSTICEFEPERVFGWAVGDPEVPAARWRFSLEPDGAGTRHPAVDADGSGRERHQRSHRADAG